MRRIFTSFIKTSRFTSKFGFSTEAARPFKVLGVQQIAIGNLDKGILSKFWGDIMGLKKVHSFKS